MRIASIFDEIGTFFYAIYRGIYVIFFAKCSEGIPSEEEQAKVRKEQYEAAGVKDPTENQ